MTIQLSDPIRKKKEKTKRVEAKITKTGTNKAQRALQKTKNLSRERIERIKKKKNLRG